MHIISYVDSVTKIFIIYKLPVGVIVHYHDDVGKLICNDVNDLNDLYYSHGILKGLKQK